MLNERTQRAAFVAVSMLGALASGAAAAQTGKGSGSTTPPPGGAEKPAEKAPANPEAKDGAKPAQTAPNAPSPLDRFVDSITGDLVDLSQYRGKVVLIVNVASKCGFTEQYRGLEQLYRSKKDAGFVVLGFPANNFRDQEPGSNADIAKFCKSRYDVTFPMFAKISVIGMDQHPLYKDLSAAPNSKEPTWNFTKYLLDRNGQVVQRFEPRTAPDDDALVKKIDELLAAKAPQGKPDTAKPTEPAKSGEAGKKTEPAKAPEPKKGG